MEKRGLIRKSFLGEKVSQEKLLEARDMVRGEHPKDVGVRRALTLRVILEMCPGKTAEEKREYYNKMYYSNSEQVYDALGIKKGPKRSDQCHRGYRRKADLNRIESLSGIRKLGHEMIRKLQDIRGRKVVRTERFYARQDKSHACVSPRFSMMLVMLEANGLAEVERGSGKRASKVLDIRLTPQGRELVDKSLKTGYLEWPELKPLFRFKSSAEKEKWLKEKGIEVKSLLDKR
ncbi:MAG: hypothetical protein V1911_01005 [Candidatus Micrarchaeota archaeon]